MHAEIAKIWVEALRSGNYTQGSYALKSNAAKPSHCCLGVLCELFQQCHPKSSMTCGVSLVRKPVDAFVTELLDVCSFDRECEVLPSRVKEWAGMDSATGYFILDGHGISLSEKNDGGASFESLACLIEDNQRHL